MRPGFPTRLLIPALVCAAALAQISDPAPSEYQVKAAFLYNFVRFVEWPADPTPAAPIEICVFGKDPFGGELQRVTEGKAVNGRPLVVRSTNDLAAARSCQVLFVSSSEARRATEILKAAAAWSVLTVGEVDRFCPRGGMINFFMDGRRVRFQINSEAATRAGLKISSKLQQLAIARGDKAKN